MSAVVGVLLLDLVSQVPLLVRVIALLVLTLAPIRWWFAFYKALVIANWKKIKEYDRTYDAWEALDTEMLQLHDQHGIQIKVLTDENADLNLRLDELIEQRIESEEQIRRQLRSWSQVFRALLPDAPQAPFMVIAPKGEPAGLAIKEADLPHAIEGAHILVLNPVTFQLLGLFTIIGRGNGYSVCLHREIFDSGWWDHAVQQARVQVNVDSQAVAVLLLPLQEA